MFPRRQFLQTSFASAAAGLLLPLNGCINGSPGVSQADIVYGRNGYGKGEFQKPRAIAIDANDDIYIVDMTGRIQVFNPDGQYQRHWNTPAVANGRPTGLSIGRDGNIWVADTHYFQALVYSPVGEMLTDRCIVGQAGIEAGSFGMVTEVAEDSQGRIYIAEYGENDRVQAFAADGRFLFQIGSHGSEPSQFMRPQSIAIDRQDNLWVADAGNHRIQIFSTHDHGAELEKIWGQDGTAAGQLRFPYDLFFDQQENLFVCEFGNHRVQQFNRAGESIWMWKSPGVGNAALYQPWGCIKDSKDRLHVLDSYHHRVYRVVI